MSSTSPPRHLAISVSRPLNPGPGLNRERREAATKRISAFHKPRRVGLLSYCLTPIFLTSSFGQFFEPVLVACLIVILGPDAILRQTPLPPLLKVHSDHIARKSPALCIIEILGVLEIGFNTLPQNLNFAQVSTLLQFLSSRLASALVHICHNGA